MITIIGIVISLVCTMLGYVLHGGNVGVLIQPTEFIIIFGCAIGIFLGSNGMVVVKSTIAGVKALISAKPITKESYLDLLKMLYSLFTLARKDGLLGLEQHVENPKESNIFSANPMFLANHHATELLCDTLKVILTGSVSSHDLSDMMETDIDIAHEEEMVPSEAVQNVGDAMPAVGIVAAVLGVIITMGKIGGEAAAIGKSVAAALVGTFLGILSGYTIFFPIARAITIKVKADGPYLQCIRHALVSFARGDAPLTCVEFARRSIEPHVRPSFNEMETTCKQK